MRLEQYKLALVLKLVTQQPLPFLELSEGLSEYFIYSLTFPMMIPLPF
jgi:hypothetical protein